MNFPLLSGQNGSAQLGRAQLGQMSIRLPGPQPNLPINGSAVTVMALPNFYRWIIARAEKGE